MDKRNVVIFVAGQRFSLSVTDSDEYVIEIGRKVDTMIKGISADNPKLNRDACAILAALDLCDDEAKARKKLESLRLQVIDYLADSDALKKENEELKAQIKELEAQLDKKNEETKAVPAAQSKTNLPAEERSVPAESEAFEPVKADSAETKAAEEEQSPADGFARQNTRRTAFTGKNFGSKHGKKNRHRKDFAPQSATKQAVTSEPVSAPEIEDAILGDDRPLPEEPPFQFSFFDNDMI